MAKLIGFFVFLALDIPLAILRGFVLSQLWVWFLVPLGVPDIGIAQAIGISVLASLLLSGLAKAGDADDDFWTAGASALVKSLAASLLCWGLGAIAHGFM